MLKEQWNHCMDNIGNLGNQAERSRGTMLGETLSTTSRFLLDVDKP